MSEIEQIENLLMEACRKLEQRRVLTFQQPPLLADCSPALRDWYGKKRAAERRKHEPPANIFQR